MSFAEQLDAIRAAGSSRIPEDKRAIMGQAKAALWESGIFDGVPKVGDTIPDFSMQTHRESNFIRPTCCRKARAS